MESIVEPKRKRRQDGNQSKNHSCKISLPPLREKFSEEDMQQIRRFNKFTFSPNHEKIQVLVDFCNHKILLEQQKNKHEFSKSFQSYGSNPLSTPRYA